MKELQYKVGDKVEITSIENLFLLHPNEYSELIGYTGNIIRIDETDDRLPYCLNNDVWVADINIKYHVKKN